MKYDNITDQYIVRCRACKEIVRYRTLQAAQKNTPFCLPCRHGKVYKRIGKKWLIPCPHCGGDNFQRTKAGMYSALKNKSWCKKCNREKMIKRLTKWTYEKLREINVIPQTNGKWQYTCPNGHTMEYTAKETCIKYHRNNICSMCKWENKKRHVEPLLDEIWKPINGFENYQISNKGRVMNEKGSILNHQKVSQKRYDAVFLYRGRRSHVKYIHRLVAEAFVPNPNKLPETDHKDFDIHNNAEYNIQWLTHGDNIRRSAKAGRMSVKKPRKNKRL